MTKNDRKGEKKQKNAKSKTKNYILKNTIISTWVGLIQEYDSTGDFDAFTKSSMILSLSKDKQEIPMVCSYS